MRRALRVAVLFLVALVCVAGLSWAVGFSGPAPEDALSRRDAFVGLLTLAVLTVVALGVDVRDWF